MIAYGVAALTGAIMGMLGLWLGKQTEKLAWEKKLLDCAENELFIEVDGGKYILLGTSKYMIMRSDAESWRVRQ